MVVRIWRTRIDESRAAEYQRFARSRSLPMFRSQPGFAGVLFAAAGEERVVITLWDDRAAAEALELSAGYLGTVAAIEATGFIQTAGAVELFELEGAQIEQHWERRLALDRARTAHRGNRDL